MESKNPEQLEAGTDTLCDDCSVVLLNSDLSDAVERMWASRSMDDCEIFVYESIYAHSGLEGHPVIGQLHGRDVLGIPIGHHRVDVFPECPALRSSANGGCSLCLSTLDTISNDRSDFSFRYEAEGRRQKEEELARSQPILIFYRGYSLYSESLVIEYQLPNLGKNRCLFFPVEAPVCTLPYPQIPKLEY
jgi:hypothetical protein